MGRQKKNHVDYDEFFSNDERAEKEASAGDLFTDYTTIGRIQRTVPLAVPVGVQTTIQPPLGAFNSPTPQLDWVLRQPRAKSTVRESDGNYELGEMDECELESHGLGHLNKGERTEAPMKKRKTQSTHPIHFWTPHIDTYVDELLRLEGRGSSTSAECSCVSCPSKSDTKEGLFRCRECFSQDLFCSKCIVRTHIINPLHRIERWTGSYFSKTTLKDLGLRIQLGHEEGICPMPDTSFNNEFVLIAQNGIHEVSLDYCGCPNSATKPVQLLRHRFFPSTVTDPKTAATFDVLEKFQLLTFNSKISGYEFYRALARQSDNTGTKPPPDRYPVFMRIIREWRHVKLLKRMGRGHSETGVKGTREGECAVLCPACPQPGMNLPDDWQDKDESEQWLYSLFIALDANFRLKRMNVSNTERDPCLNHGYAYMVESKKFEEYLAIYDGKVSEEKSTCNNHDAIKSASSRGGCGTAASGLGTAECSRHDMKRPLAVGDLQKGERYVNMDYFFLSSIQNTTLRRIVSSYDIACQWWKNLFRRCQVYPPNTLSSIADLILVFLVPKFHLPAHISKCQTSFSFNFTPRVGRTDGEAPERGWSAANGIASSTKEMGPGSRNDTLDDHFGDYNWRKITSMPETFVRKAKEALFEREEQVESFIEFDAALPLDSTKLWTKLCRAWEKDSNQPNPYVVQKDDLMNESDVRLRLAEEDSQALTRGEIVSLHEDVSPSMLICQGLQFDELQRRLADDISKLGTHSTSLQQSKILERSNSLRRRIDAWIAIQHLYMPAVAVRRSRDNSLATSPVAIQDVKLFLPSSSQDILCLAPLNLVKSEWEYRLAQAKETLEQLRAFLLLRSHMWKSKDRHSRGQRQQTRSLKLVSDVQDKISFATKSYRLTYAALEVLATRLSDTSWNQIYQPLLDTDVAGLSSDDNGSEGRKRLTWIWKVKGSGAQNDDCTQAALRVEWCKVRARAHRWQEECLLLAEEMRRVIAFFNSQVAWWNSLAETSASTTTNQSIREGKAAYAFRQADIRRQMIVHCLREWGDLPEKLVTMPDRNASVFVECH